jgi:predicted transcriptional regulator
MSTAKEGNKAEKAIRVSEDVKKRLDKIARYLAEKADKKDVPYGEVVSFLAQQFEESQNESQTPKTTRV